MREAVQRMKWPAGYCRSLRRTVMRSGTAVLLAFPFVLSLPAQTIAPSDNVHPMIGTAPSRTVSAMKHGSGTENNAQVIPAVTMPSGMTNWTPQTRMVETKCVAPYYYTDSVISGFRGTHWISGSCTQDFGSMSVMPLSGTAQLFSGRRTSWFSHAQEISSPFYYKVALPDQRAEAEVTATTRCGMLRFTFTGTDTAVILLTPNSDRGEGSVDLDASTHRVTVRNPVHRIYQGWGEPAGFSGHFAVQFDRSWSSFGTFGPKGVIHTVNPSDRQPGGMYVVIPLGKQKSVTVSIGSSFVSGENAAMNLEREVGAKSFDQVRAELTAEWNRTLSLVELPSATESQRIQFATAMYHSMMQPRIYNDGNGEFPSFGGGDSTAFVRTGDYYDDFSMWDIYRALLPLYSILTPEKGADMARSLLTKARQGSWLPIFPCWNSYTSAMIGDHSIAAIADAVMKGMITLTDEEYAMLRKNAMESPASSEEYRNGKGRRALTSYLKYGYVPLEDSVKESFHKGEQVSRTMEYAFDDFALSQIAGTMGKKGDQRMFLRRAQNYRNVFDSTVLCVRGRSADGSFTPQFVKTEKMPYITEGTPWQYTWYVPHDLSGLQSLMGGPKKFRAELDAFFAAGQYWHGNEPGHQIPFLYSATGDISATHAAVRTIMNEEYDDTPGGLSGNDDSGQMSAWYVFGMIGLYPLCPSKPEYVLSGPMTDRVVLHLPNERTVTISAPGLSSGTKRITGVRWNGADVNGNIITHQQLISGGTLEYILGEK